MSRDKSFEILLRKALDGLRMQNAGDTALFISSVGMGKSTDIGSDMCQVAENEIIRDGNKLFSRIITLRKDIEVDTARKNVYVKAIMYLDYKMHRFDNITPDKDIIDQRIRELKTAVKQRNAQLIDYACKIVLIDKKVKETQASIDAIIYPEKGRYEIFYESSEMWYDLLEADINRACRKSSEIRSGMYFLLIELQENIKEHTRLLAEVEALNLNNANVSTILDQLSEQPMLSDEENNKLILQAEKLEFDNKKSELSRVLTRLHNLPRLYEAYQEEFNDNRAIYKDFIEYNGNIEINTDKCKFFIEQYLKVLELPNLVPIDWNEKFIPENRMETDSEEEVSANFIGSCAQSASDDAGLAGEKDKEDLPDANGDMAQSAFAKNEFQNRRQLLMLRWRNIDSYLSSANEIDELDWQHISDVMRELRQDFRKLFWLNTKQDLDVSVLDKLEIDTEKLEMLIPHGETTAHRQQGHSAIMRTLRSPKFFIPIDPPVCAISADRSPCNIEHGCSGIDYK